MSKNNSTNSSNAKRASVHSHPVMASLQEAGLLDGILDSWLAESLATGKSLDSSGFLGDMLKAALERGLQAELSSHVGYEKGDPAGSNGGNSRNGSYVKTVESSAGPLTVHVPRDRQGSFSPALVPVGSRRLGGLDDMIISLYARGMTIRDIQSHLESTLSTCISADTISQVCDCVLDEVITWQNRPLDDIYPIMFIDAMIVKIREGNHVKNKAANIIIGVDVDGIKHVLGVWITPNEGAKGWANIFTKVNPSWGQRCGHYLL